MCVWVAADDDVVAGCRVGVGQAEKEGCLLVLLLLLLLYMPEQHGRPGQLLSIEHELPCSAIGVVRSFVVHLSSGDGPHTSLSLALPADSRQHVVSLSHLLSLSLTHSLTHSLSRGSCRHFSLFFLFFFIFRIFQHFGRLRVFKILERRCSVSRRVSVYGSVRYNRN